MSTVQENSMREDDFGPGNLSVDEVLALAEYEHAPHIGAKELGDSLLHSSQGQWRIRRFIIDQIEVSKARGDAARAARLSGILRHFVQRFPNTGSLI